MVDYNSIRGSMRLGGQHKGLGVLRTTRPVNTRRSRLFRPECRAVRDF